MSKFLKRNIDTIFVMLGNACNLNCEYCLQHALVEHPITNKINPKIYDFFYEIADNNDKPVQLHFYGGEPLLYFDTIKEIVENLDLEHHKFAFSIITNGKLLNMDMVDFFNEYDFSVMVSWDGENSNKTRGYNVFEDTIHKIVTFQIRKLSVSGVISSIVYPKQLLADFQKISLEYEAEQGYAVAQNIDFIFDTGIDKQYLFDIDYDRVSEEITDMVTRYIDDCINNTNTISFAEKLFIDRLVNCVKYYYLQDNVRKEWAFSSCGNGLNVLNMDLEGNLYPCHNTDTNCGSIVSNYFDYLNNLLLLDKTLTHKEYCQECVAYAFCMGGCKMVGDKANDNSPYCKLRKAIFIPILIALQEYGSKLMQNERTTNESVNS